MQLLFPILYEKWREWRLMEFSLRYNRLRSGRKFRRWSLRKLFVSARRVRRLISKWETRSRRRVARRVDDPTRANGNSLLYVNYFVGAVWGNYGGNASSLRSTIKLNEAKSRYTSHRRWYCNSREMILPLKLHLRRPGKCRERERATCGSIW